MFFNKVTRLATNIRFFSSKSGMKAIRVHKFGGPEVLQIDEVPIPTPQAGQVLIKVHSVGINPVETYIRSGTHVIKPNLPYTPGYEAAGEVSGVGEGVNNLKVGDRVWMNSSLTGSYAQYSLVKSENVHPLHESLSYDQGAALWISYATAYHSLYHIAHVTPNSRVLVHGASGGVGIASLQWCRRIPGCFTIGTAGTDKGLQNIIQQGANAVFNHRQEGYMQEIYKETNNNGVDVILEMLANVNLGKDLPILAKHGRVCVIGNRGPVEINARELMSRRASICGVALGNATPEENNEMVVEIQKAITDAHSPLRPVIGRSYKLSEVSKAHTEIINPPPEDSGAQGKVVLHPWE